MLRNYLKVALRHLTRHRGYTFINVAGLAVGMACCLLILLYVQDELRYDRFHEKADRIARIVRTQSAMTNGPIGPAAAAEIPGVERFVRLDDLNGLLLRTSPERAFEPRILAADSAFFDVFTFPLLHGTSEAALDAPYDVVLTASTARRFFGREDVVGEAITAELQEPTTFTVSAIVADPPAHSHLQFDVLLSFQLVAQASSRMENWYTNWLTTYLLLGPGTSAEDVEAALPDLAARHAETYDPSYHDYRVQPLGDVYLRSAHLGYDIAPMGSLTYVLVFSAVALLILALACINFINLSTARAARRAQEVGMRKVVGATRRQLVFQFLGESVLLALGAVVLASGIVSALLPAFRTLTGKVLTLGALDAGFLAASMVAIGLVAGLFAGAYPAFVLSAFRPAETLKKTALGARGGARFRQTLVVFQFAVSVFLVVGTLVIARQLDYVRTARLGFDREQVVVLPIEEAAEDDPERVRAQLGAHPNVVSVSVAGSIPGPGTSDYVYRPEGWTDADNLPNYNTYFADEAYLPTLGIELALGRNLDPERPSDSTAFLINETMWASLIEDAGETWRDPLGKQLDFYLPGREGWSVASTGPVVGVVKDFHYYSLHQNIFPLVIQLAPQAFDLALVKIRPDDVPGTLAFLEAQWEQIQPDRPFEYTFLDDQYDALYRSEQQTATLFAYFAGLALLIACLGLFGLAAFTAERRTKEIGVRKVLGASVPSILLLLSKEFVRLLLVAFVVAAPLAYFAMRSWLADFAFRTGLSWPLFAAAGLATLVVALLTVSYQALKAALANPAESLRME